MCILVYKLVSYIIIYKFVSDIIDLPIILEHALHDKYTSFIYSMNQTWSMVFKTYHCYKNIQHIIV